MSTHIWAAVVAMLLVGFTARFVGFLGGAYSAAVSPVILSFVLGVTVEGTLGDIGPRVGGWLLAGAARDHRGAVPVAPPSTPRDPRRVGSRV